MIPYQVYINIELIVCAVVNTSSKTYPGLERTACSNINLRTIT